MRFCCPNCGRDEEILADRKPHCLYCHVGMIAASDYSQLWMSPYIAIRRMATISETYGVERARTDGRFKKEREAWTIVIGPLNANTEGFQSTVCAGYLRPLDVTSIRVRKSAEPKIDSTETKEVSPIGCWGNSDPESRESRNRLPPCPALPAGRDRDHGPGRHR